MTKVCIVGGTGQMGQWFGRFFEQNGCEVTLCGRKTKVTYKECASDADVVVISVPIHATEETIKKVGPLVKKESLLMDLTSLKVMPMNAMRKNSSAEIVGTHPVFGPSVDGVKDQTVVLCPIQGGRWYAWLKGLLEKSGAKIQVTTPEHHDKLMSVIQGILHFSSITITHTLKELGIKVRESEQFSSPIYKLRLDMIGRILNQDPRLYADIEIMNPHSVKAIRKYLDTSKKLLKKIEAKDTNGFVSYFKEASDYLGDFREEAEEYSNYLIKKILERKK